MSRIIQLTLTVTLEDGASEEDYEQCFRNVDFIAEFCSSNGMYTNDSEAEVKEHDWDTEWIEADLPCEREKEDDGTWTCINDHTGCIWNNGHNECGHDHPHSNRPLEDEAEGLI